MANNKLMTYGKDQPSKIIHCVIYRRLVVSKQQPSLQSSKDVALGPKDAISVRVYDFILLGGSGKSQVYRPTLVHHLLSLYGAMIAINLELTIGT
jgi:hypothetical protein